MHAILSLLEDHRLWTVENRIGHLSIPMRRQAMHEHRM